MDTNAVAKLYMKEPGSRRLVSWVGHPATGFLPSVRVCVARIVLPEAISAITQRRNERKVERHGVLKLWSSVLADFSGTTSRYEVVELTEAVVLRAALLVATYGLRGYDAVQLASAISIQMGLDDPLRLLFVSSDGALTRAAKAAGLATADPTA